MQIMAKRLKRAIESRAHTIERRKHARYTTPLPVKLEILIPNGKHILNLLTSNICAGGALCGTDRVFPIGAEVKVSLIVQSEGIKKRTGARTLIKVNGRVARCGPEGMAIRFYKDYKIQKIVDSDWQLQ
jgi:hypothetical protein